MSVAMAGNDANLPPSMRKNSLQFIAPENPVRMKCVEIMNHAYFDGFILACITFNSVLLMLTHPYENPVDYANVHWPTADCQTDPETGDFLPGCTPIGRDGEGELYFVVDDDGKYVWNSNEDEPGGISRFQEQTELLFNIIYTLEMSIKIIGMGFWRHEGAYLRDAWNWIDFTVVVSAWVSFASSADGLGFLRTFRILRPLRTLNRFPEMKSLIATMLNSLVKLGSLGLLLMFFFVGFGILGVQLFQGTTHGKCMIGDWKSTNDTFEIDGVVYWNKDALITDLWDESGEETTKSTLWDYDPLFGDKVPPPGSYFLMDENDGDALCALNDWQFWSEQGAPIFVGETLDREFGRKCDPIELHGVTIPRFCARYSWAEGAAKGFFNIPTYGTGNFDSFFEACATMWTSITLEGWVDMMYSLGEGFGQAYLYFGEASGYAVQFYFMLMILLGQYFILNLVLAVIEEQYGNSKDDADGEEDGEEGGIAYAPTGENTDNMKSTNVESGAGSDEGGLIPIFYDVTENAIFQNVVNLSILLNTITMGIYHYGNEDEFIQDGVSEGMSASLIDILNGFEWTFFFIFWVEMIVKLLGLGPRAYVKDTWNVFDGFIVLSSTVDVVLTIASDGGGTDLSFFEGVAHIPIDPLVQASL